MSKKHFIALADTIRHANAHDYADHFTDSQLDVLARFCKVQNYEFKRQRWLDYINGKCGPNGGAIKGRAA